jgi:hypothetical protein
MTAKECLRHPWLANNRKTTSSTSNKGTTPSKGEAPEPRRVGCQSCPAPSTQNLRKYLSKSREALFEKVISQQKIHSQMKEDLRKSTLLQRYNKTRRLCESQMSLVSKTREIAEQRAMTRSREKLYGLRSLSKSHEVLNLYKSLANLQQGEGEEKALPGILKTLTRATTAGSLLSKGGEESAEPREEEKVGEAKEEAESEMARRLSGAGVDDEDKENDLANNNLVEGKGKRRPSLQLGKLAEERGGEPPSPATSNATTLSLTTSESDISEEDGCSPHLDEDEPRYTVAQLVSAYNMHQEIVTKSSLEVTMGSGQSTGKGDNHKFPTGPNALRLFIPNINISSRPKRGSRQETATPESTPLIHEIAEKEASGEVAARLEAPPPKYLRSGSVSSASSWEDESAKKTPSPEPKSTVAKTVELFNNVINSTPRPNRKSFSSPRPPPVIPNEPSDKIRRKSSPPTMKPNF